MDGIQGDLREQACCSSSVGCFQSFLLLFFFFFLPISWLACNWDNFKGSWAFVLPTDVSPYSLIWSLQMGLAFKNLNHSVLLWTVSHLGCLHSVYWQNQRSGQCASTKEIPVLKRFDFHAVSLKCNSSFTGVVTEYIHLTLLNETLVSWVVMLLWNTFAVEWSSDSRVAHADLAVLLIHSFGNGSRLGNV